MFACPEDAKSLTNIKIAYNSEFPRHSKQFWDKLCVIFFKTSKRKSWFACPEAAWSAACRDTALQAMKSFGFEADALLLASDNKVFSPNELMNHEDYIKKPF